MFSFWKTRDQTSAWVDHGSALEDSFILICVILYIVERVYESCYFISAGLYPYILLPRLLSLILGYLSFYIYIYMGYSCVVIMILKIISITTAVIILKIVSAESTNRYSTVHF